MSDVNATSAQMNSGLYLDYSAPSPDGFSIEDIAIGLSRQARFNGQTKMSHTYSVAEHSVFVSLIVPKEYALAALFHDGSEAFMGDISTPLKRILPDYRRIEALMQRAVYERVGITQEIPQDMYRAIKKADLIAFATERVQLMRPDGKFWPGVDGAEPMDFKLHKMTVEQSYFYFMDRYVSVIEDVPFIKERALWQAQHDDWADRNLVLPNKKTTAERGRMKAA